MNLAINWTEDEISQTFNHIRLQAKDRFVTMLPSFPLAAALLDQYALLSVLNKQQGVQSSNQLPNSSAADLLQQNATSLDALLPSLVYSRLLAANSSASLSPPTPQKPSTKKSKGFLVKDILEDTNNDNSNEREDHVDSASASPKPSFDPSSSSTAVKRHSIANAGPLSELCKLASRPIIEDEDNDSAHHDVQNMVLNQMLIPAQATLGRAAGQFGSCPNLDQVSTSAFASFLQQQQRLHQQAANLAASSALNQSVGSSTTASHHPNHHRFQSSKKTSASMSNMALHSLSLVRRKRKTRTSFTPHQIAELEKRFFKQKYLTSTDRDELATTLNLTAGQVITWFQNRRAKLKRDIEEMKNDLKLDGVDNQDRCESVSSASLPQSESFAEEDVNMEEEGEKFSSQIFAASEPSIHHLVSASSISPKGQFK